MKRVCVMASDDQFVTSQAAPDHYRELRSYLLQAKKDYLEKPEEYWTEFGYHSWFDFAPDDLTSKYPEQAEKMRNDPASYPELRQFLRGVMRGSWFITSHPECDDGLVEYQVICTTDHEVID